MKTLIVEDDFTSRLLLHTLLSRYGDCQVAVDGQEAVMAFTRAMEEKAPFDLICMDTMMPGMDGHEALQTIRALEKEREVPEEREVKIIMTTALDDPKNVVQAYYKGGATSYLVKPIDRGRLLQELSLLGLLDRDRDED